MPTKSVTVPQSLLGGFQLESFQVTPNANPGSAAKRRILWRYLEVPASEIYGWKIECSAPMLRYDLLVVGLEDPSFETTDTAVLWPTVTHLAQMPLCTCV